MPTATKLREWPKQRARGAADIVIQSVDASTPQLVLESVPGVDQVADLLRRQVQASRQRAGMRLHEGL
ncbi:MAG: hypothetical protein JXA87_14540 [Thermoleophilia bacterium]|nr:hypothetical protein [Thermoleophilia bacterium]